MSLPTDTRATGATASGPSGRRGVAARLGGRRALLFGFALAVMADPVSSVAYAIEAALRALDGRLSLLLPAMAVVVAVIALVVSNYQQIVRRFPKGGGAPAATARAFGDAWAFIPIGALVVDFVLTIAISVAAGASAILGVLPGLTAVRIPLALGLLVLVGGLTWFGHGGRLAFAVMTTLFVLAAVWVIVAGLLADVPSGASYAGTTVADGGSRAPSLAVLLAFPVAMALATGVEAPSSAIAQLGQLDDDGRRHFGRVTLWATLVVVGSLTIGLTALAVHLKVGVPGNDATLVADLARAVDSPGVFGYFQATSSLLLLAAAASSFQAGPGLLKALSQTEAADEESFERPPVTGILPGWLGRTNRFHTPYLATGVYVLASAAVVVLAGAREQELVLFYAVAVFISFLAGLSSIARFSLAEGRRAGFVINLVGAVVVALVLAVNLARGFPVVSLLAALLVAAGLYWAWVRAGRPTASA